MIFFDDLTVLFNIRCTKFCDIKLVCSYLNYTVLLQVIV